MGRKSWGNALTLSALRFASSGPGRRRVRIGIRLCRTLGGPGHLVFGEGEVAAAPDTHGRGLDWREFDGWAHERFRGDVARDTSSVRW